MAASRRRGGFEFGPFCVRVTLMGISFHERAPRGGNLSGNEYVPSVLSSAHRTGRFRVEIRGGVQGGIPPGISYTLRENGKAGDMKRMQRNTRQ